MWNVHSIPFVTNKFGAEFIKCYFATAVSGAEYRVYIFTRASHTYLKVLQDHNEMELLLHQFDPLLDGLVIVDIAHIQPEVPEQLVGTDGLAAPPASDILE